MPKKINKVVATARPKKSRKPKKIVPAGQPALDKTVPTKYRPFSDIRVSKRLDTLSKKDRYLIAVPDGEKHYLYAATAANVEEAKKNIKPGTVKV